MSEVIQFQSLKNKRFAKWAKLIAYVIERDQDLIVGTTRKQERLKELTEMFPEAVVEIVPMGVKICKRK